jgi:ribosomal protein S18 acetylase RimI-like enzyme
VLRLSFSVWRPNRKGDLLIKVWQTGELTDKARILTYLETDRLYAAYAIGDLEPHLFAQSTWVGAEKAGRLQALALHFCGLKLPVLFLMGDTDGLRAILDSTLHLEQAYITCRKEHLAMIRDFYAWDRVIPMWRMVLEPERFQGTKGDCIRLTPAHSDQLAELYALGGGIGFSATQVQYGVFFGIFVERKLVAVAGTHLISATYGIAAVGNVFTHPNHRKRGYGTATTSAVVTELLQSGIHDIILNVSQDNAGAIRLYERLGFKRYCPFLEGQACMRSIAESHRET